MRWLIASVLAVFVTTGVTMGDAEAQAFKPRGGAKATPAKNATAKKASPAKKAAAPKKAKSAKKSSRAAQSSARTEDLTPDDSPAKRSDPEDDDDYVVIVDD